LLFSMRDSPEENCSRDRIVMAFVSSMLCNRQNYHHKQTNTTCFRNSL
jgi:hypothetical protein